MNRSIEKMREEEASGSSLVTSSTQEEEDAVKDVTVPITSLISECYLRSAENIVMDTLVWLGLMQTRRGAHPSH